MKTGTKPIPKKKKPTARRKTARTTTGKHEGTKESSNNTEKNSQSGTEGDSLFGHGDQIGATFSKGLDLAEAGLSLGLTLINRFGTIVQDSVMEKISGVMSAASNAPSDGTATSEQTTAYDNEQAPSSEPSEAMGQQDPAYYIVNRLPLTPGQSVQVSFSINNDSMDTPKRVKLKADGFTGATQGHTFSSKRFTVTPGTKTILPMDFEKFVLKGEIPKDISPDVYTGRILVFSDQAIEIPVRLLVTSAT